MTTKKNFEFIYSPRTSISNIKEKEEKMFADLKIGFDPYTIKIMKKHYKEHLGKLNKETFVSILKRHLLTWYPNIPNRSRLLIKLLSRLFDEIDLNSNGDLEWEEFVNYIINSSYQQNNIHSSYGLQHYSLSKEEFFDHQDNLDNSMLNTLANKMENIISHCFYIKKFKLMGIVHEGKSRILFFNAENNKKKNIVIDLSETQNEINKMEIKDLNQKTIIKLEKERKQRLEIQNYYNNDNLNQLKGIESIDKNKVINQNKKEEKDKEENISQILSYKLNVFKISDEMEISKSKNKKGLFALATCFIEEYNLLFISSSNNKISAWKYDNKIEEFKNVNFINYTKPSDFHFEVDRLDIPLFMANAPQNNLIYDQTLKCLYSGQENGKINKWEMDSPYPSYVFDIYENKNKITIENLTRNKLEDINKNEEVFTLGKIKLLNNSYEKENSGEIGREKEEFFKIEKNSRSILSFKHKRDNVSYLLLIENLRLLCSSFLNGQIILWDADTKRPIKVFTDQNTGIYNMAYDPKKNQIFTCGFDHDIFIYEPHNNENATYKLKGHNSSINSLVINPELNELISMDVSGIIKIWDTFTYVNFQTINTNDMLLLVQNRMINSKNDINMNNSNKKKLYNNNYLLCYNNPKKILVYGSKLLIFEKGKEKNPNLTDDNPLLSCVYNKLSKDLITISNKRIKIWNIFTGKMKKSYEDLMKGNEITAFTCDKQMKRFYLGDNSGNIKCFNLSTGDFIKDFIKHENEIVNVIHSSKNELLISCSSDLCIKFQDDKELLSTELIKEIYARPGNYYQINYRIKLNITILDENNGILMIGLSNGSILHYDVDHYKFFLNPNEDQDIKLNKLAPISNMCDIDNIDFLFVSCENGEKFFTAKAKNRLYHYLADDKFGNFIDEDNNSKNIVLSSAFDYRSYSLITGGHSGIIFCYDLKPLYDFMKINEDKSEEEIKKNYNKGLNIYIKYKIQIHKEAIKYISIPLELEPNIIISTSNDKTVKLIELKTGKYIDTLRQISIKYNSVPIGIRYIKDNPFIPKEEKKKKEIITIFKKDIMLPLKRPFINYDEANHTEIIIFFFFMMEFNAKMKLLNLSRGQKIPENKSTSWNYNVNIKHLLRKNEEETKKLIEIVDKKEDEINKAEKQHQELSIFNDNYSPAFIENLDKDEKNELKNQISIKIRNINLAISKNQMLKKESENINNFLTKTKFGGNNKEENNKSKTLKPIKLIKKRNDLNNSKISEKNNENNLLIKSAIIDEKSTTIKTKKFLPNKLNIKVNFPESTKNKKVEIPKLFKLNRPNYLNKSSSQPDIFHNKNNSEIIFNDKRFKDCKIEFDSKLKELNTPFALLRKKKKLNLLPKITKINGLFSK